MTTSISAEAAVASTSTTGQPSPDAHTLQPITSSSFENDSLPSSLPPVTPFTILPRPVASTSSAPLLSATAAVVGVTREPKMTLLRRTPETLLQAESENRDADGALLAGDGEGSTVALTEERVEKVLELPKDQRPLELEDEKRTPNYLAASSSPPDAASGPPTNTNAVLMESPTALGEAKVGGDGELGLDPALMTALLLPRDRFLLMRAEVEMDRFLADPSMVRLPMSPPHFPPALNSYQRLLIHRLADTFGIKREVEPVTAAAWAAVAPAASAMNVPTGIVVLVKGDAARLPRMKLASYVPAPAAAPLLTKPSPSISTPSTPASASLSSSPSVSVDPSPSSSTLNLPHQQNLPPPPQQFFKILPRSSHHTTSSTSSSAGDDDSKGRGRREMTLEEREAAYKEARERIFNSESASTSTEGDLLETTSSTSQHRSTTVSGTLTGSVGAGITRPSSTGSTYSRSSNISSLMGSRPSPSLASDSGSSMSLHSSFQSSGPPNAYYPQGYPVQYASVPNRFQAAGGGRGLGVLRPSAPSFDPNGAAEGDWGQQIPAAYYPHYANEVNGDYSNGQQYGISMVEAASSSGSLEYERDWSRSQQTPRQSLHPYAYPQHQSSQQQQYLQQQQQHRSQQQANDLQTGHPSAQRAPQSYSYPPIRQPQQPPIQITAPSPLPRHANWPPVTSPPASSSTYTQPLSPQETFYNQRTTSLPSSTTSWSTPQSTAGQHSLPSPSLSTSSGGSFHQRMQPQYPNDSLPPPPPPSFVQPAPSSASGALSPPAGYIMRFVDGPTVQARSVSSVSSTNSSTGSTTSRTQATTATSGSGSGSFVGVATGAGVGLAAGVGSGVGLGERRKLGEMKGHSHAASAASSDGVISALGSSDKELKEGEGERDEGEGGSSEGTRSTKEGSPSNPLHPSLPPKPVWVTASPPVERALPAPKSGAMPLSPSVGSASKSSTEGATSTMTPGRRTYSTVTASNVVVPPPPPPPAQSQQHYSPSVAPSHADLSSSHHPHSHMDPSSYATSSSSISSTQLPTTISQQSFYPRHTAPSASSSSSTTSTQWWDPSLLPPPPPPPSGPYSSNNETYYAHQQLHPQQPQFPASHNPFSHSHLGQTPNPHSNQFQSYDPMLDQHHSQLHLQNQQQQQQQYYSTPPPPPPHFGGGVTEQELMMLPSSSGVGMGMGMGGGTDMRRPPPRSTELFDPNKPLPVGAGSVGMGRAGSGVNNGGVGGGRGRGRGRGKMGEEGEREAEMDKAERELEGVRL